VVARTIAVLQRSGAGVVTLLFGACMMCKRPANEMKGLWTRICLVCFGDEE